MSNSKFQLSEVLRDGLRVDNEAFTVKVIPQLDPKDYAKVKSILTRLGGKWSTSDQVFNFTHSPKERIDRALLCGTRALNKFQLHPTPEVVWQTIKRTEPIDGLYPRDRPLMVLEPHIGTGLLAEAFSAFAHKRGIDFELDGYEIDPLNVVLCEDRWNVTEANFLKVCPEPVYDLIIMNPPFKGKEYIKHILHAQKFLSEYGALVAVTPTGWTQYDVDSDLISTLYGKAVTNSAEFMSDAFFFPKKTFDGVSIETTLCVLDSISQEQAYLASAMAVELAVSTFDLFVTNNYRMYKRREQLAQKIEDARESDANVLVTEFVDCCLHKAMQEGVHINRCFVRDIVIAELATHHQSAPCVVPVNITEQPALCF